MGDVFTPFDLVVFFAALIGVMAVGLIAGRKEDTSEDYFLAGRRLPWWGVAGSIFGSNVSANHMVGMMGAGFSVGFALSHFELGAIFGLLVLCYGLLPVYRKLNVYTLSEYLGRRYDDRSRVAYAIIMVLIMAVVQMVPGLYIGSRTICVLMGGDALVEVSEETQQRGDKVFLAGDGNGAATDDLDERMEPPPPEPASDARTRFHVNENYYLGFVIALAVISASYTIIGGLKAVVWTDVMQSLLLLVAGIGISILTFQKIGGWGAMMALDQASEGAGKMSLYLPSDHPRLPWTGVFTGLIAMHLYYWGTNQFIVQRALGARSDAEARMGIVAAGFLKLLIPFFSIGTGVAAFYLFREELPHQQVDPDAAFSELVKLVIPVGYGIIGVISAGLIGAILSSIDSMMNSAATIVTVDLYKRYINPRATERQMILVGRLSIVAFVVFAAWLAITVLDPNSEENFFLQIADYQNYFTPGLLVAFLLGMFWRRGTATAAFLAIIGGVFFSWLVEYAYNHHLAGFPVVSSRLGDELNFFHRVVGVVTLCTLVYVIVSLFGKRDPEKSRLVWTDLGGHAPHDLRNILTAIAVSVGVFAVLGWTMYAGWLAPTVAAFLGAGWTLLMFARSLTRSMVKQRDEQGRQSITVAAILREDRFWAGILCALAVFMHFYFY